MPEEEYMNGPDTKAAAIELYGGIHNTDIGKVARMVTGFAARRRVPRHRLRFWTFDLAAAYAKISYGPGAVQHIGVELRDGRFMFFIGGVFGLTSMPFAFNIITQAIVWELNNKLIEGDMDQFVDDGIVISLDVEEEEDIRLARHFLTGLLGPQAIAEHKFLRCPAIVFIGYQMDITAWLVSVSQRNILKAIYAFGTVDLTPNAMIPIKKIQQLASLGSRYGYICHTIRPFVRVLYQAYTGRTRMRATTLTDQARAVTRTFRNMFVMMGLRGDTFSRSLDSFTSKPHRWVGEFDASLAGVGIIWFAVEADGSEKAAAYSSLDITRYEFGQDASFQNTAEYIASVLVAWGLELLGASGQPVLLRGDSVSALSWAMRGVTRSDRAIPAAVMGNQFLMVKQVQVVDTVHLSHELNSRTDILSRGGSWADVLAEDSSHYRSSLPRECRFLDLQDSPLLDLLDPMADINTEDGFNEFFKASLTFLQTQPAGASA